MFRAYKTELDLNNKQITFMRQCVGTARFVFNWALSDRVERHKQGLSTNQFEQKRRFNAIKIEQFPWICKMPYTIGEAEFQFCDWAFQRFYKSLKSNGKVGLPSFKSKRRNTQSFTLRGCISVESSRVRLPHIGWVRLKESDYLPTGEKVMFANISHRAGHWQISVHVKEPELVIHHNGVGVIGVDVGVKCLATCSDGTVFENPKALRRYEHRIAHVNRELCRRVNGSKNRIKSKNKLDRLHYKVSNIRRHSLHEVSHYLTAIAKPEVIVIEGLDVVGLLRDRLVSKSVLDASFGVFRKQLAYKCQWNGIKLLIADRFYPSSKTCSACGNVKPMIQLSERTYVCESCGAVIDRDFNASLNLAALVEPRNGRGLPVEGRSLSPLKQEPSGNLDSTHKSRTIRKDTPITAGGLLSS